MYFIITFILFPILIISIIAILVYNGFFINLTNLFFKPNLYKKRKELNDAIVETEYLIKKLDKQKKKLEKQIKNNVKE